MTTFARTSVISPAGIVATVVGVGVPVVLLAPAATRADVWKQHQVPALTALGFQVVSVETRGCPPSTSPAGPYRVPDLVEDAVGVIAELGAGPVHLIGASLGAMVAQELCLTRPDLVRSVALLGTRARVDAFRRAAARASVHRLQSPSPGPADAELEAIALMSQLFSPRTLDDDVLATDWLALYSAFPLRGAGLAAQYQAAAGYDDRLEALGAVRARCLVVGFEHDLITPPAACRAVADAVPGARYVEIGGAGHFGFLERPDRVNSALAGFLRSS